MKMVKSLVLGSAAGLLAMSGAQAADLPVKAKAVEYVRIAPCMVRVSSTSRAPTPASSSVAICALTPLSTARLQCAGMVWRSRSAQPLRDYFAARSRMALTVDTRTATEYGVVRTFGQGDFQFTTLGNNRQPDSVNGVAAGRHSTNLLTRPAAAMSRSKWCSSSSQASPSVSRLRPTLRRGMVIPGNNTRSCSAAMTPSPA